MFVTPNRMMNGASAMLEPVHLNLPVRAEHGRQSGVVVWVFLCYACVLTLCMTTTTALVVVQHVQTREMSARLDFLTGRVSDIPSLMSTLHGDIQEVQGEVEGQGAWLQGMADAQSARIEQLANGTIMLVDVLQSAFGAGRV